MDSNHLSSMSSNRHDRQRNGQFLEAPYVVKAGSGSSPSILSPRNENDFFLSTSAANATTAGKYARQTSTETGRDSRILNSVASPLPQGQAPGALPLFSPSEGFTAQQPQSTLFTAGLTARQPLHNVTTALDSCLDPLLPTPPDNNLFNLRLPSFNQLGIAAPHPNDINDDEEKLLIQSILPDRITITSPIRAPRPHLRNSDSIEFNVGANTPEPYYEPSRQLEQHNYFPQPISTLGTHPELLDVLTPPDDEPDVKLEIRWMPPIENLGDERKTGTGGLNLSEGEQTVAGALQAGSSGGADSAAAGQAFGESVVVETDSPTWLEDAIQAILSSVNTASLNGRAFQVLSHALPSPSIPGHIFPKIIKRIHSSSPNSPTVWVNLLHAVPGRFNLADLPTSPPETPGQPFGASDDYFTTKFFSSAVTAVDYESGVKPTALGQHRPLAAPETINLSIVERYIPPSSINEFVNLFNTRGPSLLVDRLVELTPNNGCLVFIYPTLQGAQTFANNYLGPILDPLLRTMCVVNGYSADLSEAIGRMPAVPHLLSFNIMRRRALALCTELNGGAAHIRKRLSQTEGTTPSGTFTLVHAATHQVVLERKIWADWWIKQEKTRVRNEVGQYFAKARQYKEGEVAEKMPIQVVREVLDGIEKRPVDRSAEVPMGIEVGVFVVRRK